MRPASPASQSRPLFLLVFCAVLLLPCPLPGAAEMARTNVLLILIDNVGYGDLGCYGNTTVRTPNIDQLARDGVRCTEFYIASPSCAPSRGAILSGRHPERTGFNYQGLRYEHLPNTHKRPLGLPASEKIIPQYLKPLGYATAAFGKWNVGFFPGGRPTERGFDEFLGHEGGNIHYYKHLYHGKNDMRRGTEAVDLRGQYTTDLFADSAVDFIRRQREKPWFVYVPFNAPHATTNANVEPGEKVQWQVPAKFLSQYGWGAEEPDTEKRFRAVLTALDDAIGRILRTVDEIGQRERTLVLCISDNGAFPNQLDGTGSGDQSNAPFRSGGGTTYEGGLRVPAVMRWPGRLPPGAVCREMLSSLDVLPLIAAAAGAALPADHVLDGRNPLPALAGQAPSPHSALHWVWNPSARQHWQGMREGSYKIVRESDEAPWQLFDLRDDIGESRDLAKTQSKRVAELAAKFEAWHTSVKAAAR